MAGQQSSPAKGDRLVVGLVRGVNGLRGLLRVEPLTDNPARFEVGSTLHREGSDEPLTVVSAHPDGRGLLVRFAEVKDRRAADRLREAYLEAEPDGSLPDKSYYWHEIIGCPVSTSDGAALGTVHDVFRVGESEVYVVHGPRGEILIPAVASLITELAPRERRIVVDAAALGLEGTDSDGMDSAGDGLDDDVTDAAKGDHRE